MFATVVRKVYWMERIMDRFSPGVDAKAKGDTTAMAGCLVDIPGILRTSPNNEVQVFRLLASV